MSENVSFEVGPYRGLRPFSDSDLDAVLFFGREREQAVLVANLLVSRLTVLYGPSGVGKSSLVRAGVVHELRDQIKKDGGNGRVVVYERWAGDPRAGLVAAIEETCGPLGPAAGLADAAAAATRAMENAPTAARRRKTPTSTMASIARQARASLVTLRAMLTTTSVNASHSHLERSRLARAAATASGTTRRPVYAMPRGLKYVETIRRRATPVEVLWKKFSGRPPGPR